MCGTPGLCGTQLEKHCVTALNALSDDNGEVVTMKYSCCRMCVIHYTVQENYDSLYSFVSGTCITFYTSELVEVTNFNFSLCLVLL